MAQTPKRGLGAGLGSLIPQNLDTAALLVNEDERVQKVALQVVTANPDQPRREFDTELLSELAVSIKEHGILQPLIVMPLSAGADKNGAKYQIIAGERRFRAAKIAGLTTVPVIVRTLKEQAQLEIAIIENVQRVDLAPLEQAISIEKLHQQFGLTYAEIGQRLGKAISTVSNIVRLIQLPADAREALNKKMITEGHARAILALKDDATAQKHLLENILANDWTVRQAERYVVAHKEGHQASAATKRIQTETPETAALSKRFNTKVYLKRTAKGGKLEIVFTSDEQLQQLLRDLQN